MKTPSLLDSRKIVSLPVGAIKPNPHQPRRQFESEELRELGESIRLYGILQPLTVRKTGPTTFELVAGERRLRAAVLAGMENVPCILLNVDAEQSGLLALVENLQRKDLDFIEEAEGLRSLIRSYGMSQEEAARCISKSQSAVANKLRILKLPPDVLEKLRSAGYTERHARALLRLAEDIQEVSGSLCWCGKKATMNTRVDGKGNVIKQGAQVLIDNQDEIRYIGLCYQHWREGRSHA